MKKGRRTKDRWEENPDEELKICLIAYIISRTADRERQTSVSLFLEEMFPEFCEQWDATLENPQ